MNPDKFKSKSTKYFNKVALQNRTIQEPALCYDILMQYLQSVPLHGCLADISCGTGNMLKLISDSHPKDLSLYGVDLSPKSVEVAKAKLDGHATLLVGDVESIPLEDASMDVVLNMHSFHHYPRPIHALSEIKRILKDDGVLYFVENDFRHLNRIRANLMLTLMNHKKGDVKKYSSRQLQKMLLAAGLKPLLVERIAKHSVLFVCEKRYV